MAVPNKHIQVMDSPDSKGLIYHVLGRLFRHNLDSSHNDEYGSPSGQIFIWTEFEGTFDADILIVKLKMTLPDSASQAGVTFRLNPKNRAIVL